MSEIDNNDRARTANIALSAFAVENYSPGAEDDETIMGDLLCNFRHLADAQGWDIEAMFAGTLQMYTWEVEEDGGKTTADFAEGGEA